MCAREMRANGAFFNGNKSSVVQSSLNPRERRLEHCWYIGKDLVPLSKVVKGLRPPEEWCTLLWMALAVSQRIHVYLINCINPLFYQQFFTDVRCGVG